MFLICALVAFAPITAHAQNCTGPDGVPGDLLYNSAYDVFQGCTTRGWMAFHESGAPALPDCPNVGDTCVDGTKYAGSLGAVRLYAPIADSASAAAWGIFNFGIAAGDVNDGRANSNVAYTHVMAGDGSYNPPPDAAPNIASNIFVICKNLNAGGHTDWYVPSLNELAVLYSNRSIIGGFVTNGPYWTSTDLTIIGGASGSAFRQLFDAVGWQNSNLRSDTLNLRCVRRS